MDKQHLKKTEVLKAVILFLSSNFVLVISYFISLSLFVWTMTFLILVNGKLITQQEDRNMKLNLVLYVLFKMCCIVFLAEVINCTLFFHLKVRFIYSYLAPFCCELFTIHRRQITLKSVPTIPCLQLAIMANMDFPSFC
jgi:L-asparagine transporter-like permease